MKVVKGTLKLSRIVVFKDEFTYLKPNKIKPNNNNDDDDNLYKSKGTTDNCNIKEKCHKNRNFHKIYLEHICIYYI